MPKWLVMVNPAAGRSATDPARVQEALEAAGVDHRLVVPDTRTVAGELFHEAAAQGVTHFAVTGGDGTVNLAVNRLLSLGLGTIPVLGILPAGTGCDLMRTFALPQDIPGAARHLATDDTYDIDVVTLEGEWGLRYFVNVAQVGVGAAAAETAVKITRRLGAVRYPVAFGVRLPRFPRARVKVTTDKRSYETEALAVIMANAQFFAGGWNVAPRATLIDGVLDIQVISASKRQAPALVPKVIKGTHLADPTVRRFSSATFEIETDVVWPLEADGDIVGNTPVRGRVVPAAIRLKI
ncbi:MAG: YegS/Rv2252/BmrU family lipid kinase [Actinobacteria bacterium]|nr:YegS/Rv2252/BmrU family lipid kinase [Actinomycetota bacterium]MCI0543588.1 YegS/Rv2252/BmrU family lipid kinase [Actinomycetota bacterium]MCI0677939.1 YegS/Rv2252/BmrU family lipid kinase [Actinomycetota bacterium]